MCPLFFVPIGLSWSWFVVFVHNRSCSTAIDAAILMAVYGRCKEVGSMYRREILWRGSILLQHFYNGKCAISWMLRHVIPDIMYPFRVKINKRAVAGGGGAHMANTKDIFGVRPPSQTCSTPARGHVGRKHIFQTIRPLAPGPRPAILTSTSVMRHWCEMTAWPGLGQPLGLILPLALMLGLGLADGLGLPLALPLPLGPALWLGLPLRDGLAWWLGLMLLSACLPLPVCFRFSAASGTLLCCAFS